MLYPVILCGGSGMRLWPLSRKTYPKQFVETSGDSSLFSKTFLRTQCLSAVDNVDMGAPIIICNHEHRFFVAATVQQLSLPKEQQPRIILEPQGRDTAPAITLAALAALEQDPEAMLLVLPSDHDLQPENSLVLAVQKALYAAQQGYMLTFGITPTSPQTALGYIKGGKALAVTDKGQDVLQVQRFVEKPHAEKAVAMLEEGGYFWNSGMFLFRADAYLEEMTQYAPTIVEMCRNAWQERTQDMDFIRPHAATFTACPANSIDYALMEHTDKVAVLPLDVRWSDLGSWEAFYETNSQYKDSAGNVCVGDVVVHKTHNSYIHAGKRLVTALGVQDLVIVETADAVLVADRHSSQDVKALVHTLQSQERKECVWHTQCFRPWGHYESLAVGDNFQVKRIVVHPGASLSLQLHYHRAEHWVVVSGTAKITNGEETFCLTENQSTYIPPVCKHRLSNPGIIPLVLIEIQSGTYLGEDDIERFDDVYGRVEKV